jgi:hypothetical protein
MIRFHFAAWLLLCSTALAHDTWVETNTNLVRTGDAVYVDLKLGNHGNDHRDFKLAGKLDLDGCTLDVILPDGRSIDLRDRLADVGYAPNEGYWTGKFVAVRTGLHLVAHQMDKVVNHGRPVRSIKSAKTCFFASPKLDSLPSAEPPPAHPLGHALEIVPVTHPVLMTGPGMPIQVRVLFNGQPHSNARISFIPQGTTLAEGADEIYERMTDETGMASFTPRTGSRYLIVTHHHTMESSDEYDSTSYSATMTILVSELCPCCGP